MKLLRRAACLACSVFLVAQSVDAISLDLTSQASIKSVAKTLVEGMLDYYKGDEYGGTPGILEPPYYWWESGAMFGSLINYRHLTGDDSYDSIITAAMQNQMAPTHDFMPQNQTSTLGNDDQAFWAQAALAAAETNFPNPSSDEPSWLALAQAVFNLQAARWDNTTCGGGLRWQIYWFNNGYDYKNSISQGCFFDIAARLGAYTANTTYLDWADKMWNWTETIGLIGSDYEVFDGSDDLLNCTEFDHVEWTYNNGIFLHGAAYMWNQTTGARQALWKTRMEGLLDRASIFFAGTDNMTMTEQACEDGDNCNVDQRSFKAYLSRWMATTTQLAPWTTDIIMPLLQASATAAAQSCVGGTDGHTCGLKWTVSGWDGSYGVGEQMSALEVIQANLISYVQGPLTNTTGGTSISDPSAGSTSADTTTVLKPITTGDRAGAGILTVLALLGTLSGGWWLLA